MDTKENVNNSKSNFFSTKGILFLFVFLVFLFIISSIFIFISINKGTLTSEKNNSHLKTTTTYSIEKVVCYSSAYGVNNEETQARWNLNLSQFTDIAIYLNLKSDITSLYIDNITFANSDGNTCDLISLPTEDVGKAPTENIESSHFERIDLDTTSIITLRYFNQNFKENCVITDIENPLIYDGSLLKRGKVTLSSLKNTVSFTIHLLDTTGQEFSYPVHLPINLENKETGETIYSGNYMEETSFTDAYFYINR